MAARKVRRLWRSALPPDRQRGRGGSGREGPGEWGGGETEEARGAPYPLPASTPARWSGATRPCSDPVA